jgi:hypothetical protein
MHTVRRFALLVGILVLGLVVACGGGDGDDSNGESGTPSSGDGSSSSSSDGGSSSSGGGGGSDSDFCSPDDFDAIYGSLDFTDFSDLESQFSQLGDALEEWADRAPGEIEDDVEVMVDALRGLIELFEEYDYDFLAIGLGASEDPRFLALESDEFTAASERVSEFCGYDFEVPSGGLSDGGTSSDGGGSTGGGGGGFSGAVGLPDDFPEELTPPDSEVTFAGNLGFGDTVSFSSTATIAEIVEYYTDALGDPTASDSESALWSVIGSETLTTVAVTGTDGDLEVVVLIASQ